MNKIYACELLRGENGNLYTKEYAEQNNISGITVKESVFDLRGEKVICNYSQIFYPDSSMILCNNIYTIDEYFFDSIENGSFEYCEDSNGNIFTYDEAQEKIEELEREMEELDEENEEEKKLIDKARENIDCLEDTRQNEIFQYYIIDDSTAERLKKSTDEIIFYSEKLDIYVLGVTHWGTSWDYVRAEFTL